MAWHNDISFRFLDPENFSNVISQYRKVGKKDLVCPISGADVRELDGRQLVTFRIFYINRERYDWVQHFRLNHYRKGIDGTYECEFLTLSNTPEGFNLGKQRLETALSIVDSRITPILTK